MYNNIAVLPLDSRPCCTDFILKIGRIGGYCVQCPPGEWYPDFIKGCDTVRMAQWLRQAAGQAEYLIVSVDMLLFGGLAPAMRYRVPQEDALERLNVFREIRKAHPGLKIYAAFSVPGSSNSAHTPQEMVNRAQCMTYSQLSHKVMLYDREEDKQALASLMEQIEPDALEDYLNVRERAWQVSLRLLELAKEDVIDFISFGSNDSSLYGLHRVRLQKLVEQVYEQDVQDKAVVYSGTDEQCQALLVRAMQEHRRKQTRFFLRYSCSGADTLVPPFEYNPVGDNLRLLLFSAGCVVVDTPQEADVVLMVNTACQSWDDYRAMEKAGHAYFLPESNHNLWDFITGIHYYMGTKRRVAVADVAFANGCDTGLVRYLEKSVDLTKLTAFGGWNTASNTLGTVIAQAAARTLYEQSGTQELACECTQVEFLMERFADDYCYQVLARPSVNSLVEEKGGSVLNMEELYEEANACAVEKMLPLVQTFFQKHFQGRTLTGDFSAKRILSMEPQIRLPWARTFEISVNMPFVVE